MATYGVTDAGFVIKTADVILSELNALFRANLGATVDLSPATPLGQLIAAMASREVEGWQGLQAVYAARDPDGAEGAALIELGAITGTVPVTPSPSVVTETLTGTTGTPIPTGNVVAVVTTGVTFVTQADVTIAAATAWAGTTGYVAGDRRKNGSNVYRCATGGTSAGSGGPTGTGTGISDGSCTWDFLGAGDGFVDVLCDSSDNGPLQALARSIVVINTPISGWSGAINVDDAVLGRGPESDTDFRLRRIAELSANGSASVDSIRAHLLKLKDATGTPLLTSASVFENVTDTTDAFGLAPHSVQAIVTYPGSPITATNEAIAESIFETKSSGIQTNGGVIISVTDDQGITHDIHFDYATPLDLWVKVIGTKDPATYGGDTAVKTALVDFSVGLIPPFPGYGVGDDVHTGVMYGPITDNVSGIVDISSITLSVDGVTYFAGPLTVARTILVVLDSSRIVVNFT